MILISAQPYCIALAKPADVHSANQASVLKDGKPLEERKLIRTPKPSPAPRINAPKVFGVRPNRPFCFRVPVTGNRPMDFTAKHLPDSLRIDSQSGIITGTAPSKQSDYVVTIRSTNAQGSDEQDFKIVVGDQLALTPPMGWNSWYIHYDRVTDRDIRAAADAMVRSGMINVGYCYVNIDDCWMKNRHDKPHRDKDGAILPNNKFPDMISLTSYIHGKGLRAGIYTSPGPWTCMGYVGSYENEEIDAQRFAEWGFDFLKYDWCSYGAGKTLPHLKKPYRQMGTILKRLDRDIVLNLCQSGMGDVWKWGGEVGGHCWRTGGDLGREAGGLSKGIYRAGLHNATLSQYAGPGQWNDPDYLLIGSVGDAHKQSKGRPTPLSPNEQYTHMSMWCLMASPLIFSGDMTKLDAFTLNILCNAEVIEVDQDPLGKQARIVRQTSNVLILAKPMEDSSLAVGLFNLSQKERVMNVHWSELEVVGKQTVRDLWRRKDLGTLNENLEATIGPHGVEMVRLWPL